MALKMGVYLGVIIIALGLVITIFGTSTREKANLADRIESSKGALTLSAYYKRGQKLGFGISPGEGWEYLLDTSDEFKVGRQYIETVPVTILINTTAAPGKNVTLEVEYSAVESQGPKVLLDVFVIKVLSKSDILKMETSTENWTSGGGIINTSEYLNERKPQLGVGIVQYDGYYQIEVIAVGYIKPLPPNSITLYIYDIEKVMDHWYLIPIGLMLMMTAVFMLIHGFRRSRRKARIKPTKSPPLRSLNLTDGGLEVKNWLSG